VYGRVRRGEVEQTRTPVVFEAAPPAGLAFVCHPYHRGGVTRWMVDAAVECARRRIPTWFVCPEPTREFLSAGGRPTVVSLLRRDGNLEMLRIVAPRVGWTYELGTGEYRALRYVTALRTAVPANVPVIVSDDPIVAKGTGVVDELIERSGAGIAIDPFTPSPTRLEAEVARAYHRLRNQGEAMRRRALALCEEAFLWSNYTDRVRAAYARSLESEADIQAAPRQGGAE
jgi:hypothetical protein